MNLKRFEELLADSPERDDLYNPWWHCDPDHDIPDFDTAAIRRTHLRAYLQHRAGRAKYLLVAEALGYQGGHFSGIPMTSERMLLGHQAVEPTVIFPSPMPQRTSRPELKKNGFIEPTGTIVWGAILNSGHDPREFVLWNAYPWHPYHKNKGLLSNRPPAKSELPHGEVVLRELMTQLGVDNVLAIGRNAERVLGEIGIQTGVARHPANGGANEFRRQFTQWLQEIDEEHPDGLD
ncbi:uracil-DNA glycosylase [bacterium]|nr:uracil-DNA glycosylase [bacterium]